jgi:CubicO group peptidase (beta-lactamase class C family)
MDPMQGGGGTMRILLAAVLAFVLAPVLARAEGWQTSSAEAQGMSSRELAGLVEFGITNGMDSVLIVRHGSIVAEAYYAPFAPGMKHRINSATKSVIGSLVSIALRDGLLTSVDQPVLGFFPGRSFANIDERKKALRLRHLLDMTSGLKWDEPLSNASLESFVQMERSRDWVQFILDRPMVREPGAAFDYNSGGPHVLSAILSKVTGRSALDYAREKLFGPLGIEDVHWRHDPQVPQGGEEYES